jgi:outer membrane protein
MAKFSSIVILLAFVSGASAAAAQSAPPAPDKVWHAPAEQGLSRDLTAHPEQKYEIDATHAYSLAELIDLAQRHNPETREAWQAARAKADDLGIARSQLFPTLTAVVLASSMRQAALLSSHFDRQTEGLFIPELHVTWLVFDGGERGATIDTAKANLLAADVSFNDTHRKLIYVVSSAYYHLLNARGQREAEEASLKNAQAVEEQAHSRLDNGMATRPDLLESTAARSQAEYDLQAAIGAEAIAHGELATSMGLPPETEFAVEGIDKVLQSTEMADSVEKEIERAFSQRPELLTQMTRLRAASASIKGARSAYIPSLSLTGDGGMARAYGELDQFPRTYAQGEIWSAGLELQWTLFDGLRREREMARAKAEKKAAEAGIDALRDQVSNEVWAAYTNMQTALRQQQAAAALLASSNEAYDATRESYSYGVRNIIDVITAQKTLAQARSEDVFARTQLLLQSATLAFRTGDLIQLPPGKGNP